MPRQMYIGEGRREEFQGKGNPATRHRDFDQNFFAGSSNGKDKEYGTTALAQATSAGSIEKIEVVPKQSANVKQTKRQRLRRHLARWWCCYGLGGIIFLAIFLPIFFLLIIPAIAQRMVETTSFPIHSVQIMRPTPSSAVLSLTASLKVPPPFTVHLDPITLQLYRPETKPIVPYVNFRLDRQKLKGNTTISVVNQTVEIADQHEYTEFLRGAVLNKTFILAAKGEATARIGVLRAKVTLDKQIELSGLAKLDGFNINSASVLLTPDEDGSNLHANLTIPNHSIVAFELGNETLNINGPNGLILGNATIENVYVGLGNNTYAAKGYFDLKKILLNLESLIAYEAQALADGNLQLEASGNATVYNGHHIEYYEAILNQLQLTGTVPLISLLAQSFSGLLDGGVAGLRNLTESLGVNLTQILQILQGGGGGAILNALVSRAVDLSPWME